MLGLQCEPELLQLDLFLSFVCWSPVHKPSLTKWPPVIFTQYDLLGLENQALEEGLIVLRRLMQFRVNVLFGSIYKRPGPWRSFVKFQKTVRVKFSCKWVYWRLRLHLWDSIFSLLGEQTCSLFIEKSRQKA